eukprot:TRINITY_DN39987_c0_g1_i3.p1 TRINITY_DN39987_c0_g1~~TRINITY_DN39987_c0_g1_i3.p1  ORF type:complete len:135 (-),score=17.04 TRINITY_DN39987_c0_g1_i3:177-581(-)
MCIRDRCNLCCGIGHPFHSLWNKHRSSIIVYAALSWPKCSKLPFLRFPPRPHLAALTQNQRMLEPTGHVLDLPPAKFLAYTHQRWLLHKVNMPQPKLATSVHTPANQGTLLADRCTEAATSCDLCDIVNQRSGS